MRLIIQNGHIIDPANQRDEVNDLYIADGRIAAIGTAPPGFDDAELLDAAGHWVIPGLVELQARLREPGQEHKGTVASETRAAAAGGITTLCCPPDTDPVIDTTAVTEQLHHLAARSQRCRVLPIGALTQGLGGEQLSEMYELKQGGCVAVSNALRPIADTLVMRRALQYAATLDITVMAHASDPYLGGGHMHAGRVSTRLGLAGIPEDAETIAVARELILVEQTGARLHFNHLSSKRAVEMVAEAQSRGLPVSADVAIHHLYLTEMDVGLFDSRCRVQPPLRSQRDLEGLRAALASGTISAISSDHQPHDADAKQATFASSEPGIAGLETLLPLVLRLHREGVCSRTDAIASITCGPARVLGIDAGTLTVGSAADICILDPARHREVDSSTWFSRGRNTPFDGWDLQGQVTHTLLGGRLVHGPETHNA